MHRHVNAAFYAEVILTVTALRLNYNRRYNVRSTHISLLNCGKTSFQVQKPVMEPSKHIIHQDT